MQQFLRRRLGRCVAASLQCASGGSMEASGARARRRDSSRYPLPASAMRCLPRRDSHPQVRCSEKHAVWSARFDRAAIGNGRRWRKRSSVRSRRRLRPRPTQLPLVPSSRDLFGLAIRTHIDLPLVSGRQVKGACVLASRCDLSRRTDMMDIPLRDWGLQKSGGRTRAGRDDPPACRPSGSRSCRDRHCLPGARVRR